MFLIIKIQVEMNLGFRKEETFIMKRKTRLQTGVDNRQVVLYARKSRITNKGDSIGVQFKQSADYAVNQLSLPEDY